MLPDELAKGNKDGYIFTITNCAKNALNGSERVDGYTLTAVPEAWARPGIWASAATKAAYSSRIPRVASTAPNWSNERWQIHDARRLICCRHAAFDDPLRSQRPLSAHDLAQKVDSHYNQLHSLKPALRRATRAWAFGAPRAVRCYC